MLLSVGITCLPANGVNGCGVKVGEIRGTWVAQSVKASDFGSGHDLMVHEFQPRVGLCTDSVETAWDPLSLSLPLP